MDQSLLSDSLIGPSRASFYVKQPDYVKQSERPRYNRQGFRHSPSVTHSLIVSQQSANNVFSSIVDWGFNPCS